MKCSSLRHAPRFAIAMVTCVSLLFSGCTSTRFHTPSQGTNFQTEIRVGDRVSCRMNDGTGKAFTVTAVEPDTLSGEAVRLPFADIASIEVTRFDGKKTLTQTGKVVGVVLWIAAEAVGALH